MPEIPPEEAIAQAHDHLAMGDLYTARAWHVRRLDRGEGNYFLVILEHGGAAIAIAAVGTNEGDVQSWSRLSESASHPISDVTAAADRMGLPQGWRAELVWQPCQASRSPLYPLWEIRTEGRTLYVDQGGTVWPTVSLGTMRG